MNPDHHKQFKCLEVQFNEVSLIKAMTEKLIKRTVTIQMWDLQDANEKLVEIIKKINQIN
jgi:hypothetical protein